MVLIPLGIFAFIWGGLYALLPPAFITTLLLPLVPLVFLVIWALPDTNTPNLKVMERFFWAALIGLLIWPNYLAFAYPGLPWITLIRAITVPMALVFLINLSIGRDFRGQMRDILVCNKDIVCLLLIFWLFMLLTIPVSAKPFGSMNRVISHMMECAIIFFIAAWLFTQPERVGRWIRTICILVIILCVVAVFEYRESRVLWANHIPSFLKIEDESVQRTLAGSARFATGKYRVISIFGTSLNFAELLGMSTALFIHQMLAARRFLAKLLILLFLPFLFWVIIATDSRLGVIGFFASILGYAFLWAVRRWSQIKQDLIGPAITLAYPAILALFMMATLFWQRLNRMVWGGGPQQASNESRQQQWDMMWPKLGSWPFGRGMATSGDTLGFANGAGVVTVDSYYITILLEFGVFGFIGFFGAMLVGSYQAGKVAINSRLDTGRDMIPLSIMLATFVVIKGVLSQDDIHMLMFMALGIVAALRWRAAKEDEISIPSRAILSSS